MNTLIRKSMILLSVGAFALSVGACRTIHGAAEDVETVTHKVQKEADQHTGEDDNMDNREHDQP